MPKLTTKQFIEKARAVHGDKYDYSKTQYEGMRRKVIITCPLHGDFEQLAHSHIYKKTNCPKCAKRNIRLTLEEFIEKANLVHDKDHYDYSMTEYVNMETMVKIRCRTHDRVFYQDPHNHVRGAEGCPLCAKKNRTIWSKETCLAKVKEFPTKKAFRENAPGAYNVAWANGWLKEFFG